MILTRALTILWLGISVQSCEFTRAYACQDTNRDGIVHDEFFSGSGGGNCGLPGNEGCRPGVPSDVFFQPGLAALLWSATLGMLLWANRGERRVQRLYFLAAWYFAALSALAKISQCAR